MSVNPYQKYKNAQYETASPEQLLLMLYNGAIKFAGQARTALEEKNIEVANNKLKKTQDVINELMVSLDLDQGGEIASNLYSLYEYMNRRLIQANIRKDPKIVDEVVGLLSEIKESWEEVITKMRQGTIQSAGGLNIEG
ncbi:flagellar export chaperone FliS [Iocasia frigidifontis]|uniref:Flagellar secretion chaperone FliS n=1 Tax=Iocasia fonsfrigidae TaxID=2682810 RepID=A0A8A7KA06_9FIRM|nr:flagellar export chaperone FliS [Iocasia fonsfrigidae]QTL96925.1 flagellar export chaperone FliS [Iocasia fonsfrigidae]